MRDIREAVEPNAHFCGFGRCFRLNYVGMPRYVFHSVVMGRPPISELVERGDEANMFVERELRFGLRNSVCGVCGLHKQFR